MVQIKYYPSAKLSILVLLLIGILPINNSYADNQKINLYEISKPYWDIKPNETLGEIIEAVVPNHINDNQKIKRQLISHIIESNAHAFINGDPKRMLAYKRLWFTNARPFETGSKAQVKRFSWGYIKETSPQK